MRRRVILKKASQCAAFMTVISLGIGVMLPTKAEAQDDSTTVPEAKVQVAVDVAEETQAETKEEVQTPNNYGPGFVVENPELDPQYELVDPEIPVEEECQAQESIIDTVAAEKVAEEEARKQQELRDYISTVGMSPDNISRITNLRLEDMHLLTEGTWWAGYEETLYDLEHTYGINAAYAMAVSTLECGHGTTRLAREENNFYGLSVSRTFSGRYECTMYFGDLMNRKYVGQGRLSVESIGPKYCPPNRQWEIYMRNYMNKKDIMQAKLKAKYGIQ